jgi:prophage regulatory protein
MEAQRLNRIIRERDLPAFCGLKRTQIQQLIQRGEFPKPIKLSASGRAKGWIEDELAIWQRQRLAARDQSSAA